MLVLLLPYGRWREFLAWDGQIGPVILGELHWLQVCGSLLYVMNHLLVSTMWDMIPYQHLSHDSWPLGFLTPQLVPINIYLCKVAEIAPWIHHSRVKPASLEWECIPDPASPRRITFWNLSILPLQDSTSQETTGDQKRWDNSPALVTSGIWLIYVAEAWGVDFP
jgi:hypothetical protein